MVKHKVRYFIFGFLVSAVLLSSFSVLGASVKQKIEVIFSGTKVNVNGSGISMKDSKGKLLQAFDYNGVTYFPLTKDLTNALQVTMKFDSKQQTYNFTKPYITKDFKVFNDEKPIDLTDKDGNKVQPFLYNGNVYLPTDLVSKALGENVYFDNKANSIYIGKRTNQGTPDLWLKDLQAFASKYSQGQSYSARYYNDIGIFDWVQDTDTDNTGKAYSNGLKFALNIPNYGNDGEWQYSNTYLLNQKYKKFKGTFVLHNSFKNTPHKSVFKIYADDKLIYTTPEITSEVLPLDFDVDVSGVIKLRIDLINNEKTIDQTGNTSRDVVIYGLVNAGLYK